MSAVEAASDIYDRLIEGWNSSDAGMMASAIAEDGIVVGFDGSQMIGSVQVQEELSAIFADHQVARYVTKVRSVTALGDDAALLHAVAGMVKPGAEEIMEERNAIQTVVATRAGEDWGAALFQTTPARFDGRPELSASLTAELSELLR